MNQTYFLGIDVGSTTAKLVLAVQRKTVEQIEDLFANAGKVPLVGFVNDLIDIGGTVVPAVGKDELCGCGTDIDAEKISLVHELPRM